MKTLLVGRVGKNRRVLNAALRACGHDVLVAEGAEAAQAIYGDKQPPMVVLAHLQQEDLSLC